MAFEQATNLLGTRPPYSHLFVAMSGLAFLLLFSVHRYVGFVLGALMLATYHLAWAPVVSDVYTTDFYITALSVFLTGFLPDRAGQTPAPWVRGLYQGYVFAILSMWFITRATGRSFYLRGFRWRTAREFPEFADSGWFTPLMNLVSTTHYTLLFMLCILIWLPERYRQWLVLSALMNLPFVLFTSVDPGTRLNFLILGLGLQYWAIPLPADEPVRVYQKVPSTVLTTP